MGNILIFALKEGIGGVEEYSLNYIRYKNSYGVDFGYVILGESTVYKKEMDKFNAKYFFIPPKKHLVKNIVSIFKLFKNQRKNYDTIYFNTSGLFYPVPYIMALFFKYRILLHSHSTKSDKKFDIKNVFHYINRSWIRKITSGNFACSKLAGEWMFGKKYINKVKVIPNAIDLQKFHMNNDINEEIRHKNGWENKIILGNIGRISEVKNHKYLIKVFKELCDLSDEYLLLLIGTGELENEIKKDVYHLGLQNKVIFYGQTKQPEYIIQCIDCIVMPSIHEGFPITLVEAQAAGIKSLVSSNITEEVNLSGNVEFLSIYSAPKVWAEKILKLDLNKKDNLEILKKAGYDVKDIDNRVKMLLRKG